MRLLSIRGGAAIAALFTATSALAGGPPGGVPAGPPAGIPMGPPPGVGGGPPAGIPAGGPPAGVPMGPPAGVPAGPPSGVNHGPPSSVTSNATHGKPDSLPGTPSTHTAGDSASSVGKAASLLKQLNAGHASDTAMAHASSKSIVGAIGAYKTSTVQAQSDLTAAQDKLTNIDQPALDAANAKLQADSQDQQYVDWQNQLAAEQAKPTDQQDAALISSLQSDIQNYQDTVLTPDQNAVDAAQAAVNADNTAIADAYTAIDAAKTGLQGSTNVQLSDPVVAQLDDLLGIPTVTPPTTTTTP